MKNKIYDELIAMGHSEEYASIRSDIQDALDNQERLQPIYTKLYDSNLPSEELAEKLAALDDEYNGYQDEIDILYSQLNKLKN